MNRSLFRRIPPLLVLCATLLTAQGCFVVLFGAGAAAGAGIVVWANGELKASDNVSVTQAQEAARKAGDEMGLIFISESRPSPDSAEVLFRTPEDTKVSVLIGRVEAATEIRIRVGFTGDEELSRTLLRQIRTHFPPVAAPPPYAPER